MLFETTTCISVSNYELLHYYAQRCGMSVSLFITSLINYAALCEKHRPKAFKSIRYRKRYNSNWKRMHIYLQCNEYEFLLDMRKLWKMSVALLIEYCMENVLDEFVKRLLCEEDNYSYRFRSYTFKFDKVCDCFRYQVIWEIMEKT